MSRKGKKRALKRMEREAGLEPPKAANQHQELLHEWRKALGLELKDVGEYTVEDAAEMREAFRDLAFRHYGIVSVGDAAPDAQKRALEATDSERLLTPRNPPPGQARRESPVVIQEPEEPDMPKNCTHPNLEIRRVRRKERIHCKDCGEEVPNVVMSRDYRHSVLDSVEDLGPKDPNQRG